MTLAQLNRKLAGIEAKVRALVVSSIKRHQKQIVRLNQQQLKKGKDSEGKQLGTYKDRGWIAQRKRYGRQTKFVDLNFYGDFQASMFVKFDATSMSLGLDATDNKKAILIHHWGEDILGLNDTNFDWLLDAICDDLYKGLNTYFK
jgi:hypothetical protein